MAANTNSKSSDTADSQALSSLSDATNSDHLAYLILEVYHMPIVERVNFKNLFGLLPPYMREVQYEVHHAEPKDQARIFFDHLTKIDEPGKFQSFLEALRSAEYKILVDALEDKDVDYESQDVYKNLVTLYFEDIVSTIDPVLISEELQALKVISSDDGEHIRNLATKQSTRAATSELLMNIPRRRANWYDAFLKILYKHDHKRLVQLIDEKVYSVLEKTTRDTSSENETRDLDVSSSSATSVSQIRSPAVSGETQPTVSETSSSTSVVDEARSSLENDVTLSTVLASSVTRGAASRQGSVPTGQTRSQGSGDGTAETVVEEVANLKSLLVKQMGYLQSLMGKVENMDRKLGRLENKLEMLVKPGNHE